MRSRLNNLEGYNGAAVTHSNSLFAVRIGPHSYHFTVSAQKLAGVMSPISDTHITEVQNDLHVVSFVVPPLVSDS